MTKRYSPAAVYTKPSSSIVRISDIPPARIWVPHAEYFAGLEMRFYAKIEKTLRIGFVRNRDIKAVRQVAGLLPHSRPFGSPMSDRGVRAHSGQLLNRELLPLWEKRAHCRWFFGTFITDLGNALEYTSHIELARLKRDVGKMLQRLGMHAIGLVEVQLIRYPLGGQGRTIQAHIHTIGYVDDPQCTEKTAAAIVAGSTVLTSWLEAPVAVFRKVLTPEDLKFYCTYMFKAPCDESWLQPDKFLRSGFSTKSYGDVNCWGALRLLEILSCMTLRNATLAHGDLVMPKGNWIRAVAGWTKQYPARNEYNYGAAFARVWANSNLRRQRAAPSIRTDATQPIDDSWNLAMRKNFQQVEKNRMRFDAR